MCFLSLRAFGAEDGTGASAAEPVLVSDSSGTLGRVEGHAPVPIATAPPATVVVEAPRTAEGIAPSAAQEHLDLEPFTARAVHTADVLGRVPGVDVMRYGGVGQGSYVRIRGSTPAQVLVVVDGVRMNPVAGGGTDLDSVPLELLDSVDVVRGAGAARYGADALGGVVVFRSAPSRTGVAAAVTGGSEGNARAAVSAITHAGKWLFDASARHERAPETFRYRDDYRDASITRENVGSRAFGGAAGARGRVVGGELALRLWGTTLEAGAPGLSEQPTPAASRAENRVTAVMRWDQVVTHTDRTVWSLDASSRAESRRYDNPRGFLGAGPVHSASTSTAQSAGASVRRAFGNLLLSGGADVRDERIEDRDVGRHARQVGGARTSVSLFAGDGLVEIDGALRVEAASGAGNSGDARGLTPLPSLGIALRGAWWTARAHGGRSFRLPTFTELYLPESETAGGNPRLQPEDAWSGDAGISVCAGDARRFGASLEVTVFETLLDEAIVFAPVSGHRFEPVNTGPSWFYGVETAGVLMLPWSSSLRGTWTRTESYREATGEPLPLRPRDRVTGRISSRPLDGPVELFAEGTWASGAYADFFGNLAVPDGKVLGGGLTLAPSRGRFAGLAMTAEATNITGADVRDALFFPQPGRAFWLTVRWRGQVRPTSQESSP